MSPLVDLVLVFNGVLRSLSKQQVLEDVQNAETEYSRLIRTLTDGGLKATSRQGQREGQLLVFIWAPPNKVAQLMRQERHSDFLHGLPSTTLPGRARDIPASPLAPADRLRLVYEYVTSLRTERGLGIAPGLQQWRRVESVMALHDRNFNETWIHQWTHQHVGFNIGFRELNKIRDQFGESVALYFAFLSSYTQALFFPSAIGVIFWAVASPYSPWYSAIITIWSVFWVEWWRARERILSVRWGTLGSFRVEKRRPEFRHEGEQSGEGNEGQSFPWWKRDIRIMLSLPVILFFAALLAALLTGIFIFEAFVTQLYQGPLHEYISLAPTILFVALVPRVLALYQSFAVRLTNWENHAHKSTHDASLTIKTFALSAIVAYLGLALSAFVYVPFGQLVMSAVQTQFAKTMTNGSTRGLFESNMHAAQNKLDAEKRLANEMFAYTVTNQVVNTIVEVVLPYVKRGVDDVRNGKKRVISEDASATDREERIFLEEVRYEVSLPEYSLFVDYAEMVTQFGYVSLWSAIWPLTPVMALLNNWLELRSDAFKIVKHSRRPLPVRADKIGPWLESLGTISWLGALTNSALVYIFRMRGNGSLSAAQGLSGAWRALLVPALLLALSSSHVYFLVRCLVQHLMHRAIWQGSNEMRILEHSQDEVKAMFLKSVQREDEIPDPDVAQLAQGVQTSTGQDEFWDRDDGVEELRRVLKAA